jgi:gliding motility-associated-like protein
MKIAKKLYLFLGCLTILVLTNHKVFSQACFTTSTIKGCVPLKIVATNCSPITDPRLILYDFGDGMGLKNSSEYTYTKAGKYFITQLINGTPSSQSDGKYMVEVFAPETPQFSVELCSDNVVSVKITSNGMPEYMIDYGETRQDIVPGLTSTTYKYSDSKVKTITVSGFIKGVGTCGSASQTITPSSKGVAAIFKQVKVLDNNSIELTFEQDKNNTYKVAELSQNTGVTRLLDIQANATSLVLGNRNINLDDFIYKINLFDKCKNAVVQALESIGTVNLKATAQAQQNLLSWQAPQYFGFVRYEIYRDGQLIDAINDASITSYADKKIVCNTSYTYRVELILHEGKSRSISINKTVTALSASLPKVVQGLSASTRNSSIILTWKYATGDIAKSVIISKSVEGVATNDIILSGNITTYTDDKNVKADEKLYCYTITYLDICGNKAPTSAAACNLLLKSTENDVNVLLNWQGTVPPNAQLFLEKIADKDIISIPVGSSYIDPKSGFTTPNIRYRLRIVTPDGVSYSNVVAVLLPSQFEIPTAFTPNADGLNDVFKPTTQKYLQNYTLTIFSQWGTILFESNSPDIGWDGNTINGSPAQSGTYIFQIKYNDSISRPTLKQGIVTLIR